MEIFLLNILTSSIVAAIITFVLNKNKEEKRYKKLLLDDVVGYSYQITENFKGSCKDFLRAINRVFVVYNSDKEVIERLKKYKENSNGENLMYLIKAMGKEVGISNEQIVDKFLLEPFVAGRKQEENYDDLF